MRLKSNIKTSFDNRKAKKDNINKRKEQSIFNNNKNKNKTINIQGKNKNNS